MNEGRPGSNVNSMRATGAAADRAAKHASPSQGPAPRFKRKPRQTALAFDVATKRTAKDERARWSCYIVGGWPEYSAWVDPREVPLCAHDHGKPNPDVMAALVPKCLVPSLFAKRCLTASWRDHQAGAVCLTYGTVGGEHKFDLWVLVG
jgi:hypothetical protein